MKDKKLINGHSIAGIVTASGIAIAVFNSDAFMLFCMLVIIFWYKVFVDKG